LHWAEHNNKQSRKGEDYVMSTSNGKLCTLLSKDQRMHTATTPLSRSNETSFSAIKDRAKLKLTVTPKDGETKSSRLERKLGLAVGDDRGSCTSTTASKSIDGTLPRNGERFKGNEKSKGAGSLLALLLLLKSSIGKEPPFGLTKMVNSSSSGELSPSLIHDREVAVPPRRHQIVLSRCWCENC